MAHGQDAFLVGFPHSSRSTCDHVPKDDPAIGITAEQSRVLAVEMKGVDLGCVASEDVGWRCWRTLVIIGHDFCIPGFPKQAIDIKTMAVLYDGVGQRRN
jgi:hypothetical protein